MITPSEGEVEWVISGVGRGRGEPECMRLADRARGRSHVRDDMFRREKQIGGIPGDETVALEKIAK